MTDPKERLFTGPFFAMCGYSFTVFLSLFQLLPTAPFHIHDIGGSRLQSGLFLGLLTYSSAFSAPVTGALADRLGRTRQLLVCSLAIAGFSALYAVAPGVTLLLVLVPIHGIVWSGLLSASGAYMTSILPRGRRVEGIAYWGMASVVALAIGPVAGLWIYQAAGWFWLCASATLMNLVMAFIATRLDEPPRAPRVADEHAPGHWIEWRVLVLSIPLFMYSYSYGAITSFSAVYADELGIRPKSLFLTTLAIVILVTRPVLGRFGDRFGYRRLFAPCLALMAFGLGLLTVASSRPAFVLAATVFGLGYRHRVPGLRGLRDPRRRGAPAWRGVRRHPGGVRHRHRDRVDADRLDLEPRRARPGVCRGGGARGLRAARFSGCGSICGSHARQAPGSSGRRGDGHVSRVPRWPLTVVMLLLIAWEPITLALYASSVVDRIVERGALAVSVLLVRVIVTSIGIAAGLAIWNDRPWAVQFARLAIALSAGATLLTALTRALPTSVAPG